MKYRFLSLIALMFSGSHARAELKEIRVVSDITEYMVVGAPSGTLTCYAAPESSFHDSQGRVEVRLHPAHELDEDTSRIFRFANNLGVEMSIDEGTPCSNFDALKKLIEDGVAKFLVNRHLTEELREGNPSYGCARILSERVTATITVEGKTYTFRSSSSFTIDGVVNEYCRR